MRGSWLCPTDRDKARLLENSVRYARARAVAAGSTGLTILFLAPRLGWWTLGLLVLSTFNLATLEPRMRHSRRPEYHAASSVLWTELIAAGAVALSGGPASPAMVLLAIPVVFCATRFPPRIVRLATTGAVGLLVLATFGLHPAASVAHPAAVMVSIAVIVGISAAVQALNRSELQVRDAAILDPLTGLLNRHSLERRLEKLAAQARVANAPISLLICDLDHFKSINDSFGHATGDVVLREVATVLRRHIRSFDLAYRIGGEEFMVVLPGSTLPEARALAERLCAATRSCRPQGIDLTMSVGVCTCQGADAGYERLFNAADAALYRAKSDGRDRVRSAPPRSTDARSGHTRTQARPPAEPAATPFSARAS